MSYSVVSKRRRELVDDAALEVFLNEQKGHLVSVDFQSEKVVLVLLKEQPKK